MATDQSDDANNDPPVRRVRPRGSDFDDKPSSGENAPKKLSLLGLFSLIGGIFALLISFIPCVGAIGIVGGLFGLILAGVALLIAKGSNHGKGIPIAGLIINLLSMVIATIWIFVIGGLASTSNNQKIEDVRTGEAIKVSAAELSSEFETNLVSAENRFKGKILEVTGTVKMVSKERIGKYTVEIGKGDDTIDCDFSDKSEIADVAVGQKVTIRGICKGVDRKSKFVILQTCILVKNPGTPSGKKMTVSASILAKDYDNNDIKADDEYKGNTLELTGQVVRVNNEATQIVVIIEGGEFSDIVCEFGKDARSSLSAYTAGKKIVLQGICEGKRSGTVTLTNCTVVK